MPFSFFPPLLRFAMPFTFTNPYTAADRAAAAAELAVGLMSPGGIPVSDASATPAREGYGSFSLSKMREALQASPPSKRKLAPASQAGIQRHFGYWKKFCESLDEEESEPPVDPHERLRRCNIVDFKLYLIWYRETHVSNRLKSYETVLKHLHQVYYETCLIEMDKMVSRELAAVCFPLSLHNIRC